MHVYVDSFQRFFQLYISGKYYDCLSNGTDLVNIQQSGLPEETVLEASDLYNLNYNNEALQNVTHDVFKRNADSHVIFHTLKTLYNTRMVRSEDLDGNLTIRERVYVNCSTYGVSCSMIYCDLNALRTQQDVGKLVMKLILNVTRLKGIDRIKKKYFLGQATSSSLSFSAIFLTRIIILRSFQIVERNEDCEIQHGCLRSNHKTGKQDFWDRCQVNILKSCHNIDC